MAERVSNIEIARDFYAYHELVFRQLFAAKTDERTVEYSADQFDTWAVAGGHMEKTARATIDLEHGGVLFQRHLLRTRLNRAARRGEGLERAFTVEAKHGHWRIVMLDRYVVEQPTEIVSSIRACLERSEKTVDQVMAFMDDQEDLASDDRLRCQMRLEMAQMSIFNGLQMMEMVIMGFQADKPPNLKRLRRKMAEVLLRESRRAIPVKRAKPAA